MDKKDEIVATAILAAFSVFVTNLMGLQFSDSCWPSIPCYFYSVPVVIIVIYLSHQIILVSSKRLAHFRDWRKSHDLKTIRLSYRKSDNLILLKIGNREWRKPSMTFSRVRVDKADGEDWSLIASNTFTLKYKEVKELVLFRVDALQQRFHLIGVDSVRSQYESYHFGEGRHDFNIEIMHGFSDKGNSYVKKLVVTAIYNGLDKIKLEFRDDDLSMEMLLSKND